MEPVGARESRMHHQSFQKVALYVELYQNLKSRGNLGPEPNPEISSGFQSNGISIYLVVGNGQWVNPGFNYFAHYFFVYVKMFVVFCDT